MTRYAAVRLLAAALFAVLVVGATMTLAHVAGGGAGVGTFLVALLLGLVSFGVLAVVLLFDSRRRQQLVRALRSGAYSDRLLDRYRRTQDEREPRDEQRAERRRHLDYALEGLRRAVNNEPATVGAPSGVAVLEDGPRPIPGAREAPAYVATRPPETSDAEPPVEPAGSQQRPPVSARVAQAAPLVRVSVTRNAHNIAVAAVRTRLTGLRDADRKSLRRAAVSRWLIRALVLLPVPSILIYRVSARRAWFGGVWDGVASRDGLLVALALVAAGAAWTFLVTRPEHGLHMGAARTLGESHALRSLLASEQLALRLAVGVAPSDAWRVVAQTNHFPPGSVIPAVAVEEALAIVEQLRLVARRRHERPVRSRIAAIARPVLTCVLPASVILFLI